MVCSLSLFVKIDERVKFGIHPQKLLQFFDFEKIVAVAEDKKH